MTPRLAALVRSELIRPDRPQFAGRGRLPLPPPADPRRRLRRAPEGRPGRAARALRRLARAARRRPRRAGRDRRLPPRAGRPLQAELGQPDDALAERAGERLAAAGRRALWRGDERAAAGLLERALELTRPLRLDVVPRARPRRGALPRPAAKPRAIADAAAERARGCRRRARRGARPRRRRRTTARACAPIRTRRAGALARRRCRCSSRPSDHAGLVHVWIALGSGSRTPRPLEDWATRPSRRSGTPGWPGSAARTLPTSMRTRLGPRPADEALRDARRAPARAPASLGAAGARLAARDARPLRRGVAARARGRASGCAS